VVERRPEAGSTTPDEQHAAGARTRPGRQAEPGSGAGVRELPRNVWAASAASFFTDVSSEMILNLLPLFMANVLGLRTSLIGLVEGAAETTSSLLKLVSGRLSDRGGRRKWLAVAGYGISTVAKPGFALASSWTGVAGARWLDRIGKGIRTAPRDALLADSIGPRQRGLAFGFHRSADTAGAVVGLLVAIGVVWHLQAGARTLDGDVFATLVWLSLVPALLGVVSLATVARDVPRPADGAAASQPTRSLGRPFFLFLGIVGIFELGNSADAFLVLRAQERGLSVLGILGVLLAFNVVYALVATPAGRLSDRLGRRPVLGMGWALYALVYLGFALAEQPWHSAVLYAAYGGYYGLAYGTAKALVADLVPAAQRGTAYGAYNATVGILGLPASLLAGILWEGVGAWHGFGPSAPFVLGAALAGVASLALTAWRPPTAAS